jgi:hypothetical protein
MGMRRPRGFWRVLHDAKNELTAAILLLGRMRAGAAVNPTEVEALLRRTALQLDEMFDDGEVSLRNVRARRYWRYSAPSRTG